MKRVLPLVCGGLDAAFLVFHGVLALWIARWPIGPELRALLQVFNIGGLLLIGFLAFTFLFCRAEWATRLGRAAALLGALVYLTRAAGELALFPAPKPAIVATCVVAGLLHLPLVRVTHAGTAVAPAGV